MHVYSGSKIVHMLRPYQLNYVARPTFWQASFKNDDHIIYCACVRVSQPCRWKITFAACVLVKKSLQIVHRPKLDGCKCESSFGEVLAEAYHVLSCTVRSGCLQDRDHVTIIIIIEPAYRPC